jgi:hypothetical protein
VPAITDPFEETAAAELRNWPPARSPSPTMPPAAVHRNACVPGVLSLSPTTVVASAEMASAMLDAAPPARSPTPANHG